MKLRYVLFSLVCFSTTLFAEILKDVLIRNNIPIESFSQKDLQAQVSSGAAETFGRTTLMVDPSLTGDEGVIGPLHVVKFERSNGTVTYRQLSSPQVSDE